MTVSYDDDLRLAHVLADAVERVTMARFRADDLRVETKPDLTPVSDADRAAEELIRHQLARTRPRDAVVGEEFGGEAQAEFTRAAGMTRNRRERELLLGRAQTARKAAG